MSISSINSLNAVAAQRVEFNAADKALRYGAVCSQKNQTDTADFSAESCPPEIGFFRIAFNRLTPEQINQINKTGRLPKNAKIIKDTNTGDYKIVNNIFGITTGTRTIPNDYELRQDVLGFTNIALKDSEGLFLKNKK